MHCLPFLIFTPSFQFGSEKCVTCSYLAGYLDEHIQPLLVQQPSLPDQEFDKDVEQMGGLPCARDGAFRLLDSMWLSFASVAQSVDIGSSPTNE